MKSTELMIGDWVSVEDLIRCRVDKIFQDYVVCLDKRDNEIIGNIMPIPLTPEILEKNGFDNEGYYRLPINENMSLEYYMYEHRLRKWYRGVDGWQNHSIIKDITFQCQCHYVHELQHALRLCGMNELADDFKI